MKRGDLILSLIFLLFFSYSCKKNDDGAPTAVYELYGSQEACEVLLSGNYNTGVLMDSLTNYALIKVNVKATGSYTITTAVLNGIHFSAEGNLNVLGDTSIRLTASGMPDKAGTVSFLVAGETSFCHFPVNITTPTLYTVDCAGAFIEGDYIKGTALDPTNRISLLIRSNGPGRLDLTGKGNGMEFVSYSIFTSATEDWMVLSGSGTPLASGETDIIMSDGNITYCVVKLVVQ